MIIFITGATDGIGLELARLYDAHDAQLILVGRKKLSELNDPLFTKESYCRADLSQPSSTRKIDEFLAKRSIDYVDIVIQNAGLGYFGEVAEQDAGDLNSMLQVNLYTPIRLTHVLLPRLEKAGGKVVLISSVEAALPAPEYATYSASKAALEGFARSVRLEYSNVAVQVIAPGAIATNFHAKTGIPESKKQKGFASPELVALKIKKAIAGRRSFVTIGASNAVASQAGRKAPFILDRAMAKRPKSSDQKEANKKRLCVITGAADGIGKALANRYGRAGYRIVGVDIDKKRSARTKKELRDKGMEVRFISADLSSERGVESLSRELEKHDTIDLFIHNAGISSVGRFGDQDIAIQERVLDINLRAPLQLSIDLLGSKRLKEGGSMVFVSSLSYYASYPGAAVYAASKDGLASFSRSLRAALSPSIKSLTVFPGPTRTAHAERYSPKGSSEKSRMTPESLAEQIFKAQQSGKGTVVPGLSLKVFAVISRQVPKVAEKVMVETVFKKL